MTKSMLVAFGCISCKLKNFLYRARGEYLTHVLRRNGSQGRVTGDVKIVNPSSIHVGEGSYINGRMIRASENAKITIGRNCMISYGVHLRTDSHNHDSTAVPMRNQGISEKDITIGDDVWIGYGAQIMSGITIGSGSIIGAGAVVTKDVAPFSVMGGVPARLIRSRKPEVADAALAHQSSEDETG